MHICQSFILFIFYTYFFNPIKKFFRCFFFHFFTRHCFSSSLYSSFFILLLIFALFFILTLFYLVNLFSIIGFHISALVCAQKNKYISCCLAQCIKSHSNPLAKSPFQADFFYPSNNILVQQSDISRLYQLRFPAL